MKVIYTENIPKHPDTNVCYRSSFLGVIGGATSVEVDDDFPDADLVDQAYAFLDNQPKNQTVSLKLGITPELQASLDEAKAECEKLVIENAELQEQLATAQGEMIAFKKDVVAMQARIDELQPATKKPTAAEVKAAKAVEAAATDETKE